MFIIANCPPIVTAIVHSTTKAIFFIAVLIAQFAMASPFFKKTALNYLATRRCSHC
jgi:hypothetical protein